MRLTACTFIVREESADVPGRHTFDALHVNAGHGYGLAEAIAAGRPHGLVVRR